ncbi:hypothetical protein ATCC90586_009703 [Pythium insidiosum]|nr:hypothetical protein ATCC90586_009703 [Pythium insidiosum]
MAAGHDGARCPELTAPAAVYYTVVPRGSPPTIDPTRTLKSVLLSRSAERLFNKLVRRHRIAVGVAYIVGFVLRGVSILGPDGIGHWLAPISLIVQLPAMLGVVLAFRVALCRHLIRTFDFWFYLAANSVWATCLAVYFQDMRIAVIPMMWIDVQNGTLLDAFLHDFYGIVRAAWVACAFLLTLLATVSLGLIADIHDVRIWSTPHRQVRVKDLLLNGVATTVVLVLRIIYRKRAVLRSQVCSAQSVECISYRWPLRLEARAQASSARCFSQRRAEFHPQKMQLRVVAQPGVYKASRVLGATLFPRCFDPSRERSTLQLVGFRVLGLVGLGSTVIMFALPPSALSRRRQDIVVAAAFTASLCFCGGVLGFTQLGLLRRLWLSFDFVFVALQLMAVHICVADLFRWRLASTLAVLSCALWMLTVLSLDALTPLARRTLGLRDIGALAVPVLLLFQAAIVVLALELSLWDSRGLQDRRFLDLTVLGRRLEFFVAPFLLSRLTTVSLWCARTLWRVATRESDDDLFFLLGNVEFDAAHQRRRQPRSNVEPMPTVELVVVTKPPQRELS